MTPNGAETYERLKSIGRSLIIPFAIIVAVAVLQTLASFQPQFVETYYSRGLYPRILRFIAIPGRLASFSVGELLLAVLVLFLAVLGAASWYRDIKRRIQRRRISTMPEGTRSKLSVRFAQYALNIASFLFPKIFWVTAVIAVSFMLVFGMNYHRLPIDQNLSLERREPDASELEAISRTIVDGVNRNYAESGAYANSESGSSLPISRAQLITLLEESFSNEPLLRGIAADSAHASPRAVFMSGLMSRMGVSGIYSPFTGEPNYNAFQPDSALPFTLAHEMAHQRGFARESEASFVAFLICTNSRDAYVRYSGYLNALRVLSLLRLRSPERFTQIYLTLGEGPRADLRAERRFWSRYAGRLSSTTRRINDAYLRANRVRSGVRNYGEVTGLIVGYYLSRRPDF
jgi:hypothetical protein